MNSTAMHQSDQNAVRFVYYSYGLVGATLILISIVFPPLQTVIFVNGLNSEGLDRFLLFVTEFGNGLILAPFSIILLFRRIYMTFGLVVSGALQGLVVILFKNVLFAFSQRPINFLDPSVMHLVPGVEVHKMMSFPSGHTVTIFGLCVFLSLCYRNHFLSMFLLSVSIIVGLSRVYLLQHFMLDVGVGAIIGSGIGILTLHFIEKTTRPAWLDQRLEISLKLSGPKVGSLDNTTVSFISNRSLPQ